MKTVVELLNDVTLSIKEMEESLKGFSALELKYQREIDKVREERKCVEANISLYKGMLDDLTKRRDNEIQIIEKKAEKPVVEVTTKVKTGGHLLPKKVILVDENGKKVETYMSQSDASRKLGINSASINYRVRKVDQNTQIKKYGYALIDG